MIRLQQRQWNAFLMTSGFWLLAPVLVLSAFLASAAPAAAQTSLPTARVTQVDATGYPAIKLSLSVTDAAGTPVGGLTAQDFQITEDGQPVTISNFAGIGAPIAAALVIDRSGSMEEAGKITGAQAAARAFVAQLRPADRAALIAFDSTPELVQPFTNDKQALNRAIRQIEPSGSTALYDSIVDATTQLRGQSGRRALIVLTDGQDRVGVEDASPASTHTLAQAIAAAHDVGIAVQVVGLGERNTGDLRAGIDEAVLTQIAEQTGGQYFYTPEAQALSELYASLASSLQREYQLTYRSPRPTNDGTRRNIQVVVGGGTATGGAYLEPHLIDVRSTPLAALLLLLPILGLLVAPRLLRRRTVDAPPATPVAAEPEPFVTHIAHASTNFCDQCGATLRPGAQFCVRCGTQISLPPGT